MKTRTTLFALIAILLVAVLASCAGRGVSPPQPRTDAPTDPAQPSGAPSATTPSVPQGPDAAPPPPGPDAASGTAQAQDPTANLPEEPDGPDDAPEDSETPGQPIRLGGMQWTVAPELEYENIWHCWMCNVFTAVPAGASEASEADYFGIDQITGLEDPDIWHNGHGGSSGFWDDYFLYDEEQGLFWRYNMDGYDTDYTFVEYTPAEFSADIGDRLIAVQLFDSNFLEQVNVYGDTFQYDPTHGLTGRFAVARGADFLSDFIYDFDMYKHGGSNRPNIIAVLYENRWGLIDRSGNIVVPFQYDDFVFILTWRSVDTEYVALKSGDKWGVVDARGALVVPFALEDIQFINDETAFAMYDGRYGILDLRGSAALNR